MAEPIAPAGTPTPAATPPAPAPAAPAAATPAASPTPQATPADTKPSPTPATPAPAPSPTAPEKYSAFVVPKGMPEGHTLAEPVVQSVEKVSRTLGLTQERAQTLVDEVVPAIHRHGQEQLDAMVRGWDAQLQSHKTLGGERLAESRATVDLAIEKLGSPELKAFLDSPFKPGRHPAVFEFMHRVGQMLQQDGFPTSRRGPSLGADQSVVDDAALAAKLYPKSAMAGA